MDVLVVDLRLEIGACPSVCLADSRSERLAGVSHTTPLVCELVSSESAQVIDRHLWPASLEILRHEPSMAMMRLMLAT